MRVHRLDRVEEFRTLAEPLLRREPARNQLLISIVHTLATAPEVYPVFRLWAVEANGEIVTAAVRTPPHNVALADPAETTALDALVAAIAEGDADAPGVVASRPYAEWFADRWKARTGESWRTTVAQGVFELRNLRPPKPAPGSPRRATPADVDLVRTWFDAFADERSPPELAERARQAPRLDTQLDDTQDAAGSGSGKRRPPHLPHRVHRDPPRRPHRPVYTPKAERGRGFASNLVAHASAWHLDRGADALLPLHRPRQSHLEQGLHRPRVRAGVRVRTTSSSFDRGLRAARGIVTRGEGGAPLRGDQRRRRSRRA